LNAPKQDIFILPRHKYEAAITVLDDIDRRFGQDESPAIRDKLLSVRKNSVEALLILGRHDDAVRTIRQVLAQVDASDQASAIMPFLLWLTQPQTP
jgi:hypothetical protein